MDVVVQKVVAAFIVAFIISLIAYFWIGGFSSEREIAEFRRRQEEGIQRSNEIIEKARQDRIAARNWFLMCESIHIENLKHNQPDEKVRITVHANGRWYVERYAGIDRGAFSWAKAQEAPSYVPKEPCARHYWTVVGEQGGFLYQTEAQKYAFEYKHNVLPELER